MIYIPISDFSEEVLQCSHTDQLSQEISEIAWIDDFLNDENIPFDFDSFSRIDNGTVYLNPKHFSVSSLIKVM